MLQRVKTHNALALRLPDSEETRIDARLAKGHVEALPSLCAAIVQPTREMRHKQFPDENLPHVDSLGDIGQYRRLMTERTSFGVARSDVAAASAAVFFGTSVVATRFVVTQVDPLSLAFLRYVIACLCFIPITRQFATASYSRRDLVAIRALGVMFFGIFPWTFSAALTYIPSSRVAVELAAMPLLTLLVSRARGYDQITAPKLIGQLLAFIGLWIALRPTSATPTGASNAWIGDVLIGVTALCGATFNVFSRPFLQRYPSIHVTSLSMFAGVVFLTPFAVTQTIRHGLPAFTSSGVLAVLFLGVLGGAVGFGLWIWALERSTPSRVAVFITLNPITAVFLGAVLLHEEISARLIMGLIFVLSGILVATWRPRPAATA